MKTTSNADFAKQVMELSEQAPPFQPTAVYDPDGDCIEFLAAPDPFYAERLDDLVTVYLSQETGELVGSVIKGVSQFCTEITRQMPGFRIEIHRGAVRLVHIFLARLWSRDSADDDLTTNTYRKLIEVAGETVVDGELCMAC